MRHLVRLAALLLCLAGASLATAATLTGTDNGLPGAPGPGAHNVPAGQYWVLVDTSAYRLEVFNGAERVLAFDNIAVGRGGVGIDRERGDSRTPLGEFRVLWVNMESQFHRFLGFNYPTYAHTRRGLDRGLLTLDEYIELAEAYRAGRIPRQNTRLGGHLGIHGLGRADPVVHDNVNWTRGCIALRDEEVDELLRYVRIGTRVVVR